jgi:hypothetical protein
MDFINNTQERLIQEHAIYKAFFDSFYNRAFTPTPNVSPVVLIKAEAFNVLDRLNRLNSGSPYYDPSWKNANDVLFTIAVNDSNT